MFSLYFSGSKFELHSDAFESSDNLDVDGSSSVSEVFQAGQIKENGFMDQGQREYVSPLFYTI